MDSTGYNSWRRPRGSASLSNLNHPSTTTRSSYPYNYGNSTSQTPRDLNTPSYTTSSQRNSSYSSPSSASNYPTSSNNNHHYTKPPSLSGYSTPIKTSPPDLTAGHSNGLSSSGTPSTTYQPTTFTTIPIHSNGTNGLHTSRYVQLDIHYLPILHR